MLFRGWDANSAGAYTYFFERKIVKGAGGDLYPHEINLVEDISGG